MNLYANVILGFKGICVQHGRSKYRLNILRKVYKNAEGIITVFAGPDYCMEYICICVKDIQLKSKV